jgi:hypothetical protein
MKFYILEADSGETVTATTTLKEAHQYAAEVGLEGYTISRAEVPVTSESIRLLLAGQGGYCREFDLVFTKE